MARTAPPPAALALGAALLQAIRARPASRLRAAGAGVLGTGSAALLGLSARDFRRNRTTLTRSRRKRPVRW